MYSYNIITVRHIFDDFGYHFCVSAWFPTGDVPTEPVMDTQPLRHATPAVVKQIVVPNPGNGLHIAYTDPYSQ